jgi:hypothetical protein
MSKKTLLITILTIGIAIAAGFYYFFYFKPGSTGIDFKAIWSSFKPGDELAAPGKSTRAANDFRLDTEIFSNPKYGRLKERNDPADPMPSPGNPNPFEGN